MSAHELNRRVTADFRPGEQVLPRSELRRKRFHPPTRWIKLAIELMRLPTSPFHEHNLLLWIWRFAQRRGLSARIDGVGNLIVSYEPAPSGSGQDSPPPLAFAAHLDHTGFWAVRMRDEKTLRAHWMGRFPEDLIVGGRVVFWTGGKPLAEAEPGLMPDAPDDFRVGGRRVGGVVTKVLGINEEGDVTGVEVEVEEPVLPGSIGMWDLPDADHRGGKFYARACDDVAGAAALVCLLDVLVREESPHPVTCVFTRAEEGGFFGAIHYCTEHYGPNATRKGPELIVSVECSKALPHAPQGLGPIVRVGDKHVMFEPEMTVWASRCARALSLREDTFLFQRKLMDGGTCESSVFQSWMGRAGALCIALGNYHNQNVEAGTIDLENVDIGDWGNLVRLMQAMVEMRELSGGVLGEFKEWCVQWSDKHKHLYFEPAGVAE